MRILLALSLLLSCTFFAAAQNEQSPIVEKDLEYKNWKYPNVLNDGESDLRHLIAGKKLVMVVYFAPWCPNWKHDVAFVQSLYEKYRNDGFQVIGVGEYDPVSSMKTHIEAYKLTFPVVYESTERTAKQKTVHYEYRKKTGDKRNWGSPWYLFLDPSSTEKKGDVLVNRAAVVNGELIKPEAETFIRKRLGLPSSTQKTTSTESGIEACDPEKPSVLTASKP